MQQGIEGEVRTFGEIIAILTMWYRGVKSEK
jgi:hypothetical protein